MKRIRLPAGKAIGRAYVAYGVSVGHREGLESAHEEIDSQMGEVVRDLKKVDARFESSCVRHKPVTALSGRK